MRAFPVIYKRNTNGSINQWQIIVDGASFYSIEGLKDGALTTSRPTKCTPKNVGRANETSPEDQAAAEAAAKFQKKLDKGYTQDIALVDSCKQHFEPMLAHKLKDYKDKITYPCLASRKIDGLRIVSQASGGWTRNGKFYPAVQHLQRIFKPLFDAHPKWVVDGEVYVEDVPFNKVVSIVKRPKPTAEDLATAERLAKTYVFDAITDDPEMGFEDRFALVRKEIARLIGNDPHIVFVENELANSYEELMALHDKYVAEGWEGLMVRACGSVYEMKRSKNLLKYKNFIDEEFIIVDILEGKGSRADMAGKLVVKLKKPTTEGKTTCESGIKGGEEYYKEIWADRLNLVGKLATIRYQGFTEKGSLRFPTAQAIDPIDR